jgi:putative Mn2+ efflux pump MntP
MGIAGIILLGIALGIDCFIASFSLGLIYTHQRRLNSFKLAVTMGLFQGLMPIIGYAATHRVYDILLPYSKIIVCTIFSALGFHFILESFSGKDESKIQCIDLKCLIGLGVATSIDALISGTTIRLTNTNLVISCLVIGFLSFIMSECGFWSGNFIKKIRTQILQIAGGVILLVLAVKSLI